MNSTTSSYPIPISLPDAVGVHRPPHQVVRGNTRLCSALENIAGGDPRLRNTLHGLPWFTPIVGSGCLALGDGPALDLTTLEQTARAEVMDMLGIAKVGDIRLDVLAVDFAEALHRSRTHGDMALCDGGISPSRGAARLAMVTALLTRLYHLTAKAEPLSWYWVSERVQISDHILQTDDHVRVELPQVEKILAFMTEGEAATVFDVSPTMLLQRILDDLTGRHRSLSISDLRLLTELTWIELIRGTSIYPGWSDLLLELLVDLSAGGGVFEGYRPQIVKLRELDESVARVLLEPTWRSWRSRRSADPLAQRDRFYSAVARVLWAEAEIHDLLHPEEPSDELDEEAYADLMNRRTAAVAAVNVIVQDTNRKRARVGLERLPPDMIVPHPAGYVTSFDLEMEMALWAMGRPFRIVVPVLVTSTQRVDAELVWLSTVIDPARDMSSDRFDIDDDAVLEDYESLDDSMDSRRVKELLEELRSLRAEARSWHMAASVLGGAAGFESGGSCPVIVRVTGSPLMVLPPVTGPLRQEMLEALGCGPEEVLTLTHALTVDEYTSVRQSEHELYFAARGERRGLPTPLSVGSEQMDRVWVGFGVQIDDPAIRLRMFTQLSASSMVKRQSQHAQPRPDGTGVSDPLGRSTSVVPPLRVRGLAVNRRIDENQSTALQWLGFQFSVDASAGELTADIEHHAEHFERIAEHLRHITQNGAPTIDGQLVDIDWDRPDNTSCPMWRRSRRKRL